MSENRGDEPDDAGDQDADDLSPEQKAKIREEHIELLEWAYSKGRHRGDYQDMELL